jgi:hypothetical protein
MKQIKDYLDEDKLALIKQSIPKLQRDRQVEIDVLKQEIETRIKGTMEDALFYLADKTAGDPRSYSAVFNKDDYLAKLDKLQCLYKIQLELTNIMSWSDQEKISFFDNLFQV